MGDTTIWLGIALYLLAQIGIGYWASRFIHNESDYLLAGRTLGVGLLSFSLFANWFGAETVMGSASAIAAHGLSGSRADPFGYTLCLIGMGFLLARVMRERRYMTLGDFFKEVYGVRTEKLSIVIMIPSSLIWAAAQLLAFGQILSLILNAHIEVALFAATCLVIIYTFLGGLLANVITEFFQSIILIVGLAILLFHVSGEVGGLTQALINLPEERWALSRPDESWLHRINTWCIPIFGSLVAQEALSRIFAARSPSVAQKASFVAAFIYFAVALIPFLIAMVGGVMIPMELMHQDHFLPSLAHRLLSKGEFVIFLAALLAAILSTLDAALLSVSALAAHNLIIPLFPKMTEYHKVSLTRFLMVLGGFAAYGIAISGESIYNLALAASSFGTACILVCTLGGLWFPTLATPTFGTLTLLLGIVITLVGDYWLDWEATFLYSLFACSALFALGCLHTRWKQLS